MESNVSFHLSKNIDVNTTKGMDKIYIKVSKNKKGVEHIDVYSTNSPTLKKVKHLLTAWYTGTKWTHGKEAVKKLGDSKITKEMLTAEGKKGEETKKAAAAAKKADKAAKHVKGGAKGAGKAPAKPKTKSPAERPNIKPHKKPAKAPEKELDLTQKMPGLPQSGQAVVKPYKDVLGVIKQAEMREEKDTNELQGMDKEIDDILGGIDTTEIDTLLPKTPPDQPESK